MVYQYPPFDIKEKQAEINKVLQKYENKKSLATSCFYLLVDISLNLCCFHLLSGRPGILSYIIYSLIQGTLLLGLWVLAHECGHGGFSNHKTINNVIGYILHEFLLVPYFAWQYTHAKHHKYTNHLIYGETHVPCKRHRPYGDAFVILSMIAGWPLYLFRNTSGGRVQYDMKTPIDKKLSASHFNPWSQIFPPKMFYYVCLDIFGIICVLCALIYYGQLYNYTGVYLVVNAWLVLYTLLQHTDKLVPHYGIDEFNFLRGALSTIDRKYPEIINILHHDIGSTHVLHHINHRIAHYHAKQAFEEIYPIIKDFYLKDDRPIYKVVYDISRNCHYVDKLEGVQFYKRNLKT